MGAPYILPADLKLQLNIKGDARDTKVELACDAATAAINKATDRDFTPVNLTEVQTERYYTPRSPRTLVVDDLLVVGEFATDLSGNGDFSIIWQEDRDFVLKPLNAAAKGEPYTAVQVHPFSRFLFSEMPRSVRITGVHGWLETPPQVEQLARILATRLYKRPDAAFGVASFGTEVAMRAMQSDPDMASLLNDLTRDTVVYA